jgi:hypothetical protein
VRYCTVVWRDEFDFLGAVCDENEGFGHLAVVLEMLFVRDSSFDIP